LIENRKLYFEASPMSYVTVGRPISSPASGAEVNQPAFLLSWGTQDDIVTTQQGVADRFYKLGLIPKPIVIRDIVWRNPAA